MELHSGRSAPSVASTPPHGEMELNATAGPASPLPPILSPQVTASEAIRMMDLPDVGDAELAEIADTLISLRAPPTQLPPPLPSESPPNSASYPGPASNSPSFILAPNETGLEGVDKLGSRSSDSRSGFEDVDDETMKKCVVSKVSEVRSDDYTKQVSAEFDDDVDDVYSLAEGRGLGQPGKTVVHVSVQPADQGPPHVPATCATGAMRELSERFSLASNVLISSNVDIFGSVLQPAGTGSAYAPLSESLKCTQRVADTPPAYADVAERAATTTASPRICEWTTSAAYSHQPAPTTPTQLPATTAMDVSPIQSTPTALPTPTSAAVSPTSTVQPTKQAERLHAELQAMEQLLGAEPSCSMDTPAATAVPGSFIYPPPPVAQSGRARCHRLHTTLTHYEFFDFAVLF